MRKIEEILKEEFIAMEKVWYDRYIPDFRRGYHKEKDPEYKEVVRGALIEAKELEKKYGKKNLGPWTQFGSGMLLGRLEALRWVLGQDWDQIDLWNF